MKKIPQFKKELGGFLTKNSKELFILGAIGTISSNSILGVQQAKADQDVTNSYIYENTIDPLATFYPTDQEALDNMPNWVSKEFTVVSSSTCGHVSGIVNGHLSSIPDVSTTSQKYTVSKRVTHSSHNSHGSGGWCI